MNLTHLAGTLLCAALVLGGGVAARGQDRHDVRKAEHRALKQHQKFERRELKESLRTERGHYGNTSDWRTRRRTQSVALRAHQRAERLASRQRYNPGRHLGRGYDRAPGQRIRLMNTPRARLSRRYIPLRSRYRR